MLFLPLEEDSLLFRVCLYYGVLVLLVELFMPLLFQRRVRIELPRVALRGPAHPLSTREFQQRRLALQQQVEALQRATAETPRWSPQKRRQVQSASASKSRSVASPSPSPSTSHTSSVKVSRPESSRKTSEAKRRINWNLEQKVEELGQDANERRRREDEVVRPDERQPPMAMGESLATRTARQGGFSFSEAIQEDTEEKSGETQGRGGWEQAMNMRTARRREPPTFSGRKPVRFVSENVGGAGYSGPSEAASRLEALIGARRSRRGITTPPTNVPLLPRQRPVETVRSAASAPSLPSTAAEKSAEPPIFNPFTRAQQEMPTPVGQREEDPIMEEDEETKESEQQETLTDFEAFCASFAAGGSAAAQQATAKRKHHEAFGSKSEQTTAGAAAARREQYKHPRVAQEDNEQPNIAASPAAAEPQRVETPKHYESFGSDDERPIEEALATQQVLEKRTHHQAFGMDDKAERPEEKTPRIVRRISFTDEVDALAASPAKETVGERSTGKRKRQQTFGMIDEDDDDAEWRSSLAFQPHHFD